MPPLRRQNVRRNWMLGCTTICQRTAVPARVVRPALASLKLQTSPTWFRSTGRREKYHSLVSTFSDSLQRLLDRTHRALPLRSLPALPPPRFTTDDLISSPVLRLPLLTVTPDHLRQVSHKSSRRRRSHPDSTAGVVLKLLSEIKILK